MFSPSLEFQSTYSSTPIDAMIIGFLPADVAPSENLGENNRGNRLPSKPAKREKWEIAKLTALENPNDLEKWNDLFRLLDEQWEQGAITSDDQKAVFKSAVALSYDSLLARFPYLTEYWKRYLILQYKISGVTESLKVLETAKEKCPQSVSLWVDFLSAKLAVHASKSKDESATENIEDIRGLFERAAAIVGPNFNSDPFWNLYIDFEAKNSQGENDTNLLRLYLRLISLPLYQYAQYYNQFAEVSKNYSLSDIITDANLLAPYLEQYQKSLVTELSIVEQHQIIDTYVYSVFTNTQKKVNEKWGFESVLTLQDFSISELDSIADQRDSWTTYLDHEIKALEAEPANTLQHELIVSLFERSLVPNCLDALMWQKYADFTESQDSGDAGSIYKRAILRFVPLSESGLRASYVKYLMRGPKFEDANDFVLGQIKLYSGQTANTIYAKEAYISAGQQLLQLWKDHVPASKYVEALDILIKGFFDRIDRYKKAATPSEQDEEKTDSKFELKQSYVTSFSKYLNDDGICIVAVAYLKALAEEPENSTKIRSFYNKHNRNVSFSHSVQFWKFFVDFEGFQHKNLVNLRTVISHIKTATSLPKLAVDYFIDIYYEITCANLAMAVSLSQNGEDYLDILVNKDAEKSDDLKVNRSARRRLADNNYLIQEYEAPKGHGGDNQEKLMNLRLKHIAHPGIFVDSVPEITNRILKGPWISLLDEKTTVPPLPICRNIGKANAPINYPDE